MNIFLALGTAILVLVIAAHNNPILENRELNLFPPLIALAYFLIVIGI